MTGIPCPCGEVHELTDSLRMDIARAARSLPPVVTVSSPDGRLWRLPRIYAACHGYRSANMADLRIPERYGVPA